MGRGQGTQATGAVAGIRRGFSLSDNVDVLMTGRAAQDLLTRLQQDEGTAFTVDVLVKRRRGLQTLSVSECELQSTRRRGKLLWRLLYATSGEHPRAYCWVPVKDIESARLRQIYPHPRPFQTESLSWGVG